MSCWGETWGGRVKVWIDFSIETDYTRFELKLLVELEEYCAFRLVEPGDADEGIVYGTLKHIGEERLIFIGHKKDAKRLIEELRRAILGS